MENDDELTQDFDDVISSSDIQYNVNYELNYDDE